MQTAPVPTTASRNNKRKLINESAGALRHTRNLIITCIILEHQGHMQWCCLVQGATWIFKQTLNDIPRACFALNYWGCFDVWRIQKAVLNLCSTDVFRSYSIYEYVSNIYKVCSLIVGLRMQRLAVPLADIEDIFPDYSCFSATKPPATCGFQGVFIYDCAPVLQLSWSTRVIALSLLLLSGTIKKLVELFQLLKASIASAASNIHSMKYNVGKLVPTFKNEMSDWLEVLQWNFQLLAEF